MPKTKQQFEQAIAHTQRKLDKWVGMDCRGHLTTSMIRITKRKLANLKRRMQELENGK